MPVKALQSLLPLLDLKIEGRNPAGIFDGYMPSLDVTDFFLWEDVRTKQAAIPNANVQGFAFVAVADQVPTDEIWVVHSMAVIETAGGTSVREMTCAITDQERFAHAVGQVSAISAGSTARLISTYTGAPLLLRPGSTYGAWFGVADGARTALATLYYRSIKI